MITQDSTVSRRRIFINSSDCLTNTIQFASSSSKTLTTFATKTKKTDQPGASWRKAFNRRNGRTVRNPILFVRARIERSVGVLSNGESCPRSDQLGCRTPRFLTRRLPRRISRMMPTVVRDISDTYVILLLSSLTRYSYSVA